jgi:hypothetical protein
MKVADALQDEQTQLMPVPRPFDGYVELLARVSSTSLIHLERTHRARQQRRQPADLPRPYCCRGRWRAGGSAPALL